MFTAVLYSEGGRFSVEQLTRHWCGRHVVEMLALFVQCTAHGTADMPGHSLWTSNLCIRSGCGTQEFTGLMIFQTFRGELTSGDVFLCDEDCCQNCEADSECHYDIQPALCNLPLLSAIVLL